MNLATFAAVATFAGLCLAPSCTEAGSDADAGVEDAGDGSATPATGTPRQTDATADCKKRGACLVQNGSTFSQSACETETRNEGERADSQTCTEPYDRYLRCVAGLTYDCSKDITAQILAGCNAQYQALGSCLTP